MTTYAPAVRAAAVPQSLYRAVAASPATTGKPATERPGDREARRRELERAERQRAHAERVRDNLAARHPLALR